ncbi:MAG: hypothetical protein WAL70_05840 [Aeromicrobium sp.]
MKKFMLLYRGAWDEAPTQETMDAWSEWFAFLGDKIVDSGNPFGPGREITKDGTADLPQDAGAVTGYTLINAQDIEDAEKIALQCPVVTSIQVYEAMPM